MRQRHSLLIVLLSAAASVGLADDLLPVDRTPHEVIDHYVQARIVAAGAETSELADDANLLRRTMLDLVGRPPTVAEARTYLESTEPDKRAQLVQRLMATPGYVRHQINEFDTLLMEGSGKSLREYLTRALEQQRPWDQMFRDLLLGEKDDPAQKGALQFVNARIGDLDKLTNESSVIFFGVNVTCAKCHDHPEVAEWTQDRFYGMKSFFSRTFDNGGLSGERDYGLVSFKTTEGEEKSAKLTFLTGQVIEEPTSKTPSDEEQKAEKKKLEELKKSKQPPPAPRFSRREQLVEVALRTSEDNYFAKAIINKIWYRLLGRGLVMPIDQMHPENPPSHPQLLEWLARDLVVNGYDLNRVVQGIVLSDTYARSSRFTGATAPAVDLFAVGQIRPLTPMQYAVSLRLGSTNPDQFPSSMPPEEFAKQMLGLENAARGYSNKFEQPRDGFQIGVAEALLFSNDTRVRDDFLRDAGNTLVGKLAKMEDPQTIVDTAFWNVMGRAPDAEERTVLIRYYQQRQDRPVEACQHIVWALLTSAQNRFNY